LTLEDAWELYEIPLLKVKALQYFKLIS
jgi:hypothetical protein